MHGVLTEDVYMKQPVGYIHPDYPTHVFKLNKSIYGLKQAPCTWCSRINTYIVEPGFKGSVAYNSLFIEKNSYGVTYVLIYVDDIIITILLLLQT